MTTPKITRPHFPPGYVDKPTKTVSWEYVVQRLSESKDYWLCSVRPETRHARNIAENPHVALHLESGDEALIAEGTSVPAGKPAPELAERLAAAYCAKYEKFGYAPKPDQWDEGGLYVFTPQKVLAWTVFMEDPTKFVLGDGEK